MKVEQRWPSTQMAPSTRVRMIVSDDGRLWTVREVQAPPYDRRGALSLVFATDDAMRRVRHYRSDWFECSDVELYAISLQK